MSNIKRVYKSFIYSFVLLLLTVYQKRGVAMIKITIQKFLFMILSLFILITLTFFLMNGVPGSPMQSEKATSAAVQKNLEAYYGLDKPIGEQYIQYLNKIAHFDFGISMKKRYYSVNKMIADSFGYSLKLGIATIVTSLVVGCYLGIIAALYHRKFYDHLAMVIAVLGLAIPSMVLAPLLQYLFAVKIPLFNTARINELKDYVLPTLALASGPIAYIAKLLRSNMIETLNSDFIKMAKAKGLAGHVIVWKHCIRNSMLPVVTYMGFLTANVITGSVIIEKVFAIPGMGSFFVSSVINRDYPLIMGTTIFYAALLVLCRFLSDMTYVVVDPRMRLAQGK